jgi:D-3-phosphoglycerate dehydrogenase / 2-oxoglutarate reductase
VLVTARVDQEVMRAAPSPLEFRLERSRREPYLPLAEDELIDELSDCQAWICEIEEATERIFAACPSLRLVVDCRGTPVNIDIPAASRHRVMVCNVPARNANATADLAVGLLLASVRSIVTSDRWVRSGSWTGQANLLAYERYKGFDLDGRKLAVIGMGAVGRRVAERCRAFGMEVIYVDPVPADDLGWATRSSSVESAVKNADVISLHAPLNSQTVGLLGAAEFAVMKEGTILVNAARAALMDKAAFLDALKRGQVARAALDVHWAEPLPPDDPLLGFEDRVILTPHIGGATIDVIRNHTLAALRCVQAMARGERPPNLLNREVLDDIQGGRNDSGE